MDQDSEGKVWYESIVYCFRNSKVFDILFVV